jgi:diacylglycerol kinase family enzyme
VQSTHARLRVGIDGELFTREAPLRVTIEPQSLRVRVPRAAVAEAPPG